CASSDSALRRSASATSAHSTRSKGARPSAETRTWYDEGSNSVPHTGQTPVRVPDAISSSRFPCRSRSRSLDPGRLGGLPAPAARAGSAARVKAALEPSPFLVGGPVGPWFLPRSPHPGRAPCSPPDRATGGGGGGGDGGGGGGG